MALGVIINALRLKFAFSQLTSSLLRLQSSTEGLRRDQWGAHHPLQNGGPAADAVSGTVLNDYMLLSNSQMWSALSSWAARTESFGESSMVCLEYTCSALAAGVTSVMPFVGKSVRPMTVLIVEAVLKYWGAATSPGIRGPTAHAVNG